MKHYKFYLVMIVVLIVAKLNEHHLYGLLDKYGQEVIIVGAILLPLAILIAIALKASNKI